MISQEQFNTAVLNVTSGQDWDIVKKGLESDIYNTQANAFTAANWGAVCELKGFANGLAYCMRLREVVINAMEQAREDAESARLTKEWAV